MISISTFILIVIFLVVFFAAIVVTIYYETETELVAMKSEHSRKIYEEIQAKVELLAKEGVLLDSLRGYHDLIKDTMLAFDNIDSLVESGELSHETYLKLKCEVYEHIRFTLTNYSLSRMNK